MRINLGYYGKEAVYYNFDSADNKHIGIVGKTGSGKSVFMQKLALGLVESGETVLALDFHNVLAHEQIFANYRNKIRKNKVEIDVYKDGLQTDLFEAIFFEDGTKEDVTDTICNVVNVLEYTCGLGTRQKSELRKAVMLMFENDFYKQGGIAALEMCLDSLGTPQAEVVCEKLFSIISHNILRPGKFPIEDSKLNIFRLSKFDLHTQIVVGELILALIWRMAQNERFKDRNLYIMIDEVQNLSLGNRSILRNLMVEGRKYGVNLILATQQTDMSAELGRYIQQAGLLAVFRSGPNYADVLARVIEPNAQRLWTQVISKLEVGEFIAVHNNSIEIANKVITSVIKIDGHEKV